MDVTYAYDRDLSREQHGRYVAGAAEMTLHRGEPTMATMLEMTSALTSHMAARDEWDERAEKLVRECAQTLLLAGI
jgi:hypothetical protein